MNDKREYKSVIKRCNGVSEMSGRQPICIHHIIYRSHGGKTVRENLIALTPNEHLHVHTDEKYYVDYLLNLNRRHYGIINKADLRKKNKWEQAFQEE
jgi:5-methylcytosine-specific restriction endonuclease McrA